MKSVDGDVIIFESMNMVDFVRNKDSKFLFLQGMQCL